MTYKRKEVIGDCTLYLGDMQEIDVSSCDLVLTDPPYKLTSGGGDIKMKGKFDKSNYNNKGDFVRCDINWQDFMPIIFNSLKDDTHAYVMCNNRHIQNLLNSAQNSGFKFHNVLVWDKGNVTPNRWYMKGLEFTGFFFKGKAKPINDCGSKQLYNKKSEKMSDHPTQKPVDLMAHYIFNSTNQGEVVFDPFMGSGTTLVACAKMKRKGVGIELDEGYFDIACKRVEDAYKQDDLFY